jgi:methionyl-tRNA formyltransferase
MSILQGLKETGVTLQVMSEAMDEGDIISQESIAIHPEHNTESLMSDLAALSVKMLERDLPNWVKGFIKTTKQDESSATYCYKDDISKSKAEITSQTSVDFAVHMIRAFYPWPIAWFINSSGKIVKIFSAEKSDKLSSLPTLSIFREEKKLYLVLTDGVIELKELQIEGKSKAFAKDYLFLAS